MYFLQGDFFGACTLGLRTAHLRRCGAAPLPGVRGERGAGAGGVTTLRHGQGWGTAQTAVRKSSSPCARLAPVLRLLVLEGFPEVGFVCGGPNKMAVGGGWAVGTWSKCLLHPSGCGNGVRPDLCNGDLWG